MKRTRAFLIIISVFMAMVGTVSAGEWGCKCIMCLSNPGGSTEFKECEEPIDKLHRHLASGHDFPKCEQAESAGYTVKTGKSKYYSCKEAYGPEWEENAFFGSGCQKFVGYREVEKLSGNRTVIEKEPVYDVKPKKKRSKPHYIDLIAQDGTKTRTWY